MINQVLTPWLYRRWNFDFPAELYPAVIQRLAGLPARVEEIGRRISPEQAVYTPEDAWSIQCHFGHLADLERLIVQRLDAYERGDSALPAADMSNERTVHADHNMRDLSEVMNELRDKRMATIARLESYGRDFFGRSAWHDRLGVQKRVVDTCVFFADHDDHHLALVRMIEQGFDR
jgi:uncharacterized damage-inducible protein DinB